MPNSQEQKTAKNNPTDNALSNEHALSITDLRKSFAEKHILRGVSLAVKPGERVALIGANGSGKSTLLRSTLRLIEPDSGQIVINEQDITKLSQRKLRGVRSSTGFVFQKHNLVPRLSALTNVIHGRQGSERGPRSWFQTFAPNTVREKAMECLSQVGLAHIASQQVQSLSGGQSQRVAFARALMQDPKMIFADEPVASLDPEAGLQVMKLLSHLAVQKKITLLFTTHHLEHALEYADRIIGLQQGQIALEERSNDYSIEQLRKFYD